MKRIKQFCSNRWQGLTAVAILVVFIASGCGKKPQTPDPLTAGVSHKQESLAGANGAEAAAPPEGVAVEDGTAAAPNPVRTRANFPPAQSIEPTPSTYGPLLRGEPRMGEQLG